jgi:intein/homing endonuclease
MLKVYNETARYVDQCFIGSTMVMTPEGSKKISDIKVGDSVMSTQGINIVTENNKFELKKLYKVKTSNGIMQVTGEHLFLAVKDGKNFENLAESLKLNMAKPEWIEAKNLSKNDYLLEYIAKTKEVECHTENFSRMTNQEQRNG